MQVVNELGFSQMVSMPTRTQGQAKNILDLFLCNNPTLINTVKNLPGIADHDAVFIEANAKPRINKKPRRKVWLYGKADWESAKAGLQSFSAKFLLACAETPPIS